MDRVVLGIDVGTSGVKALLVSEEGAVLGKAGSEYALSSPRPLWAEQDPEDWWKAVGTAVRAAMKEARCSPRLLAGIGLTGQMHGLVALDSAGSPVRPCILWNDQRSSKECAEMTELVGRERLLRITGKPALPGFTAPKILWVRRHEQADYDQIRHILLPKDYIRHRLAGVYHTDVADASGTCLLDTELRLWSPEILSALEIPEAWMPEVFESTEATAFVSSEVGAEIGIPAGVPVVAWAGDQAAEAVGCGVLAGNEISLAVGTSGVIFAGMPAYRHDPEGRAHTYCHAVPGAWHVMGVMLSAGGSLRWYRDTFGEPEKEAAAQHGIDPYDLLSEYAARIPPVSDGLFFLPYLTGERTPHPDPNARGLFFGITLRHTRHHFTRAVMEGVAFALRDCMELIKSMGFDSGAVRASGGGARSDVWRRIFADVLDADICTVNVSEGAAFGAALLAGVGVGLYANIEEAVSRTVRVTGITVPGSDVETYATAYRKYRMLYPALKECFGPSDLG